MSRYQLIKSLTIIYLFFQCLNVDKASAKQCQKDSLSWLCPDGKQCGDTYRSCTDDSGALDTTGIIVLTIFSIVMMCLSATSIYYFCAHRRRLARGAFARERQTTTDAHTQQQVSIHIISDTQMNTELPIIETPPPSYGQIQKKETKDGCENI